MILPVHTTAIPGGKAYRPLLVPNVEGAAGATLGGVSLSAAGTVLVSGSLAKTLGGVSLSAAGDVIGLPTASLLVAGSTTSGSTSFNTTSISPGANRLVLLFVVSSDAGGADPGTPTVSGGGLSTWVHVRGRFYGGARRISCFRGMSASPGSGQVTIDFGGSNSQNSACWSIIEVADVDTSGSDGSGAVVQSTDLGATGTGSTISLAALQHANNIHICGVGTVAATTITPDAQFTELSDQQQTVDDITLETQWARNEVDCTPSHVNTTHAYISLEIKAS